MSTEALPVASSAAAPVPFIDRLHGWVTTVDHKRLGLLYLGYALLFLVFGGLEAAVMRCQLKGPQSTWSPRRPSTACSRCTARP